MLSTNTKTKILALTFMSMLLFATPFNAEAQKKKGKSAAEPEKKFLRVLYWNIQDGMWSDQENNYDNFVAWVKEVDPDICVFCEASTIYATDNREEIPLEDRYLPDHWGELCARWGHTHWAKGPQRKSSSYKFGICNYPQVVTSRYPIETIARFEGVRPDSVMVSGSAWHQIKVEGVEKPFNIVPIHAYAFRHGYGIKAETDHERDSLRAISRSKNEGEFQRIKEFKYTCDHTIRKSADPDSEYWIMLGDFNGYSRTDNYKYKYNEATIGFASQEYMNRETPYYDLVAQMLPGIFLPTHKNTHRIDYIFVSKALLNACAGVDCPRDSYCKPQRIEGSKLYYPSDHSPIIADFRISKLK